MHNFTPYQKRPIRFLDLWQIGEWRLKAYGIAYGKSLPSQPLIEAAQILAQNLLARCTRAMECYNAGFVGVHEGKTSNFVFVDWWAEENELHHHVFVSSLESPEKLEYMTPTGLTACVWDLYLMSFERQAWVDCVLKNPTGPDLEAYLQKRVNIDI